MPLQLVRIILSHPGFPPGGEDYKWICVPFGKPPTVEFPIRPVNPNASPLLTLVEELISPSSAYVRARHQDRHAGIPFRFGWNEDIRTAVLWVDL